MHDSDNPLMNIPPHAFTIIQASHSEFHKYLSDIPVRYPKGRITYINNHQFVPLLKLNEKYQGRLDHLKISTFSELLTIIASDNSAILFMEYAMKWFGIDKPDDMLLFNEMCRKRAKQGGPVVVITAIMDRALLALDGKADYFFQIGTVSLRGRRLAIKEQTRLDEVPVGTSGNVEKRRMFGQMKLGDW